MGMFGRSKTQVMKDNAATGTDLALTLARDKKFRKELATALGHGMRARRRAASRFGMTAVAMRLATDEELRRELQTMAQNLQQAWHRVERKRSHRGRNTTMVVLGAGGAVAGAYLWRKRS